MLKFLLTLQICSKVLMECTTPIVVYPTYNSHYDCATAGFINSLGVVRELGEEYVNLNRVYVNFSCEPEETI